MSVPKSKRGTTQLEILTESAKLARYTIHICSNEKHFPKRYRWCITGKIVDSAIDILRFNKMANAIPIDGDKGMFDLRTHYQTMALANTYSLLSMIDIAYLTFGIDGDRIETWTGMILKIQNMIRNWKKANKQQFDNKVNS